jgi:hypothetical protein
LIAYLEHVYQFKSTKQRIAQAQAAFKQCQNTNLKAGAPLSAAVGTKAAALIDCIAIIAVTVATLAVLMLLCVCENLI